MTENALDFSRIPLSATLYLIILSNWIYQIANVMKRDQSLNNVTLFLEFVNAMDLWKEKIVTNAR